MVSRNARVAIASAIIIPVMGIASLFVYFGVMRGPESNHAVLASTVVSIEPAAPVENEAPSGDSSTVSPATPDENPLRPIGPAPSDRAVYRSSGSCSSGSCVTPIPPRRSGCSSCD